MEADSARELKARILHDVGRRAARPAAAPRPGAGGVAVGLVPGGGGRAGVAVRLAGEGDRALLPELGRAASAEIDVRVIGPVHALTSAGCAAVPGDPGWLRRRSRPLRPGVSIGHPAVSAGTLGGLVRVGSALAVLSNRHVLTGGGDAGRGEPVLQPGPADGGGAADRVATTAGAVPLTVGRANAVDAALAVLDAGVAAEPAWFPGGPLAAAVPGGRDIEPEEVVEKLGRTTGHTRGTVTAVEVDGLSVVYDDPAGRTAGRVLHFDDQVEISGAGAGFSAAGDSGAVIWRSADRGPLALLFAGSSRGGPAGTGVTFAHPLATVLDLLDATWVAG